ncbi:MAG: CRTAC1 family protein [Planctomycetota bacterium]|jgi:tetratricopeptide (TPR) repeat protein
MSETVDRNWNGTRVRVGVAALVIGLVLIGSAFWFLFVPDVDALLQQGRKEFVLGNSQAALELAEESLTHRPDDVAALLLAADAGFALEEFDLALDYYRRVPDDSTQEAVYARFLCGRIEFHHVGDTAAAEASFRSALKREPDNRNGLFQLVSLLGIQGRAREATPFVLRLFRQGAFYPEFLDLLRSEEAALLNRDELQRYQRVTPDDAGVLTGLAWHARSSGKLQEAITLLNRALESSPHFTQARVALASILWKHKQHARLRRLLAEEQTRTIDDAALWIVRGNLAAHDGLPRTAVRSFWEAWQQDPTSRVATYRLYRYLSGQGDDANASAMSRQLNRLQTLQERSDLVRSTRHASSAPVRQLVGSLEDVGRLWEAWGWCVVARDRYPDAAWVEPQLTALSRQLETAPLTVVCRRTVPIELDLSHLPLPQWTSMPTESPGATDALTSNVSFRDDAPAVGIPFQYFNSPSRAGEGQRMYEFNGGGAGVLDFDQDGWPDLHFTQGCQRPARDEDNEHLDRLFRNLTAAGFDDVTELAGLAENLFSTGVAIGDFDNDGFPDIHVANIGRNRLFRNNGDGTFEDVTDEAGVDDPRWSTSCVMADLNGDALPDIYSVNYLSGDTVFEDVCQHDDGHPRMCMPFHFPGEQDQLFLNRGDGRFVNVTNETGIQSANGKGLGVVAADWNQNGRLSLFVANDTVANFLFVNAGSDDHGMLQFVESGLLSGAAVNREGRAEGCMGIAAGDANGDGTLDMFVTNFLHETNTLYLSDAAAVFQDATREAGLAEPSRDLLGFGTQFLDADLDGHLDLLISNGHIDDYRRYGRPYTMPAQFFSNDGAGRFVEHRPEIVGPYFERRVLGRGMSRLDWNRDGFEDVVISHLHQPAALLTNTTQEPNDFVALRLRGVKSSRDAHGATVVVQTENRKITRQLTAGDGYQASNERVLVFGLGCSATVRSIDVRWPSGITESFRPAAANYEYLIVEGTGSMTRRPGASD